MNELKQILQDNIITLIFGTIATIIFTISKIKAHKTGEKYKINFTELINLYQEAEQIFGPKTGEQKLKYVIKKTNCKTKKDVKKTIEQIENIHKVLKTASNTEKEKNHETI